MSLPTLDTFSAVESRFFHRLGGSFHRLAIDDAGARVFVAAEFFAEFPMEGDVNLLPNTAVHPFMIIVAHQFIVGKFFGEISPWTSGFVQIKDRINDLAQIRGSGAARGIRIGLFNQRL